MKVNPETYFIIDFDSTFIKSEALDELASISLAKAADKQEKVKKIREITRLASDGKISFPRSLMLRIKLMNADGSHIPLLIKRLKKQISKSVLRNKQFFRKFSDNIIIISGGFKEYICPIVKDFYIPGSRVFANSFILNSDGKITGYDKHNQLSKNNGKVRQLKILKLKGEVIAIGDGYSDYELKSTGLVHKFFAFTENIERKFILDKADYVTPSFDEFLYLSKLPMAISYPKNRINILMLENIHAEAYNIFKEEGYRVEVVRSRINENDLLREIENVSVLCIRSGTPVTEKILNNAKKLLAIGAFCIGVNHIDLTACSKKGVVVFNAPFSNTRSVVELTVAEIIALMRRLTEKNNQLHSGIWNKSSVESYEIRGKKLGIIGYGNIGSQLSVLAEALGMVVYYYDVVDKLALGNAVRCRTMPEILKKSDIISVHVDGRFENMNLIGESEFKKMKDGVVFLNLSRGFVVDLNAMKKYLINGKIRGAAIDVFPAEPDFNNSPLPEIISELSGIPNLILTPHVGGSTREAQKNIADFVPSKIIDFINSGNSYYSVNFPNIQLPSFEKAHRLIHIHENVPGILANINGTLAGHNINVIGQYLKTNEIIGYVITDISKKYNPELIQKLRKIPHTIKFRVLY